MDDPSPPCDDYWVQRCRAAEELIALYDDQGRGALGGMLVCALSGLLTGLGLGWWLL